MSIFVVTMSILEAIQDAKKGPAEIVGESWLVSCCYKKSIISEMSQKGKLENTYEECYHCN